MAVAVREDKVGSDSSPVPENRLHGGVLLIGFFLLFVDCYRDPALSRSGAVFSAPSPLLALLVPGLTNTPWVLDYLETKSAFFVFMMACLVGAGWNYLGVYPARVQAILSAASLYFVLYLLGEQKLWTPAGLSLAVLTLFYTFTGRDNRSIQHGLSFLLAVAGSETFFGPAPGVDAMVGVAAMVCAVLLSRPPTLTPCSKILSLAFFGYGWLSRQYGFVLIGVLAWQLSCAEEGQAKKRPRPLFLPIGMALALLAVSPTFEGVHRPLGLIPITGVEEARWTLAFQKESQARSYIDVDVSAGSAVGEDMIQIRPHDLNLVPVVYYSGWFKKANLPLILSPAYRRCIERKIQQQNKTLAVSSRLEVKPRSATP